MDSDLKPKERFSGLADAYAKARPGYPEEVIDFVIKHCRLKAGDVLVDIGSGTGISSRVFSKRGLKVIGIEPNEEMRKQALFINSQIEGNHQLPIYQNGSGEETGLPDHSAHAVLSAQAFHWLDPEKALAEFARILKPSGWVILIWNEGNYSHALTKDYRDLVRQYSNKELDTIVKLRQNGGSPLLESRLFCRGEKLIFANEQILDEQGLLNRALSSSYLCKDPAAREALINGLKELFQQKQENGFVTLKYNLELYVARCP